MTVVVDIGNARIKWARVRHGALSEFGEALHVDDVEQALKLFSADVTTEVNRIVGTNVAGGNIAARLNKLADECWGVSPEWINTSSEQFGVTCGYAEPCRLGVDRWVAVLAAYERASGAACVIDAGTAVTFDAVDAEGKHLGGLIMAGPRLVTATLRSETSEIGNTTMSEKIPRGLQLMGRSTDEAVAHGAMLGVAAAVDRALKVVTDALRTEPLILLTGGHAKALCPWLESTVQYREHLVLEGLALIAKKS